MAHYLRVSLFAVCVFVIIVSRIEGIDSRGRMQLPNQPRITTTRTTPRTIRPHLNPYQSGGAAQRMLVRPPKGPDFTISPPLTTTTTAQPGTVGHAQLQDRKAKHGKGNQETTTLPPTPKRRRAALLPKCGTGTADQKVQPGGGGPDRPPTPITCFPITSTTPRVIKDDRWEQVDRSLG